MKQICLKKLNSRSHTYISTGHYFMASFTMATFSISQNTANMMGCSDVWPTNSTLFATARSKMPEHAQQLDDLLLQTQQAMSQKIALENSIQACQYSRGIPYVHSDEWPTNLSAFLDAVGSASDKQKQDLHNLWALASKGLSAKRKLDSTIVQILGDIFTGDAYGETAEEQADPWDAMTEEEKADYTRQCEEDSAKEPWCNHCHSESDCDGDHGDEMRGGFLLHKGPSISPITVPKVQDAWTEEDYHEHCAAEDNRHECPSCNYRNPSHTSMCLMCGQMSTPPEQQERPSCNPGGCSWPFECRCGWQYDPLHQVLEFRDGTAKWDPSTEVWTWTSKYTDDMIPPGTHYNRQHRMHFPYQRQEQQEQQEDEQQEEQQQQQQQQQEQQQEQQEDEDHEWARDLERIVAESKAIREAHLSTFLPSFLIDDEDDEEVDIEAA